jgi:hypothetical protein
MKIERLLQIFEKKTQIHNFTKICLVGAKLFHADGQTYGKANSRFSQFCERAYKFYKEVIVFKAVGCLYPSLRF